MGRIIRQYKRDPNYVLERTTKAIDVACPTCDALPGKPCTSLRIPSANTLGGGWGGYPPTKRPHEARYDERRRYLATEPCGDCDKPTVNSAQRVHVGNQSGHWYRCTECHDKKMQRVRDAAKLQRDKDKVRARVRKQMGGK